MSKLRGLGFGKEEQKEPGKKPVAKEKAAPARKPAAKAAVAEQKSGPEAAPVPENNNGSADAGEKSWRDIEGGHECQQLVLYLTNDLYLDMIELLALEKIKMRRENPGMTIFEYHTHNKIMEELLKGRKGK